MNANAMHDDGLQRCGWAYGSVLERDYHDREWGTPQHDERRLFEFITLEGAQAGLSWRTILQKRDGYRRAFLDYDVERIAALSDAELEQRLTDPGIVRNRLKVWSVRSNAQATRALYERGGTLDALLWSFVDGKPLVRRPATMRDVPASTPESDRMSKALQKQGFRFVGTTICYALMQACGLVDDHVVGCHCADRQRPCAPHGE